MDEPRRYNGAELSNTTALHPLPGLSASRSIGTGVRNLLIVCGIGIIIKALFYFLDPRPAIFMGDSAAYLDTAAHDYIPPDRSFTFGYLLKLIALWPHSLNTVVLTQLAMSTAACCILAIILLRYLRLSLAPACILTALCAMEPLQLLSERYVLTEATATFLFAALIWTAFAYWRTGRFWLLLILSPVGVLLISVRVAFLPAVLLLSVAVPLLAPPTRTSRRWMVVTIGLMLSIASSQFLLREYRLLYRSLYNPKVRPAYLYADGYFLLSDFAPVVTPADYPDDGSRAWVFSHLGVPLSDPQARDAQRWWNNGLCTVIEHAPGLNDYTGNRVARKTALHAIRRNPVGFARLVLINISGYFQRPFLKKMITMDEEYGWQLTSKESTFFRDLFGFTHRSSDDDSLIHKWHRFTWPWYPLLILVPGLYTFALAVLHRRASSIDWFLLLPAWSLWITAAVTISRPTPRYETPLAWLAFALAGTVWQLTRTRRSRPV